VKQSEIVTIQPQLICEPEWGEWRCLLFSHGFHLGGRAFGPPLCRGCAPATTPSKNMPHPPYAVIPAVRPVQRWQRPTITRWESPSGGGIEGLVRTGAVYGSAVTRNHRRLALGSTWSCSPSCFAGHPCSSPVCFSAQCP